MKALTLTLTLGIINAQNVFTVNGDTLKKGNSYVIKTSDEIYSGKYYGSDSLNIFLDDEGVITKISKSSVSRNENISNNRNISKYIYKPEFIVTKSFNASFGTNYLSKEISGSDNNFGASFGLSAGFSIATSEISNFRFNADLSYEPGKYEHDNGQGIVILSANYLFGELSKNQKINYYGLVGLGFNVWWFLRDSKTIFGSINVGAGLCYNVNNKIGLFTEVRIDDLAAFSPIGLFRLGVDNIPIRFGVNIGF